MFVLWAERVISGNHACIKVGEYPTLQASVVAMQSMWALSFHCVGPMGEHYVERETTCQDDADYVVVDFVEQGVDACR